MHEWTEQAQQEAEDKVFRMAANDPSFRQLALTDGRAAVEKATGRSLPEGFQIRFVDPAGAHLTAVLPRAAYEEEELADHELMAVAGGKGGKRKNSPTSVGGGTGGQQPTDGNIAEF
jgi:CubicO group peptidase (beta-lactamase class C family)